MIEEHAPQTRKELATSGRNTGLRNEHCSVMGEVVGQVTIGPLCVSFQVQASIVRCYHGGDVPVSHCIVRVVPASQLQPQGAIVCCR